MTGIIGEREEGRSEYHWLRRAALDEHFPGLIDAVLRATGWQPDGRLRGPNHGGNVTPMPEPSILSVLRERAGLQPDDTPFAFADYEQIRAPNREYVVDA